jgi:hypothetical protein
VLDFLVFRLYVYIYIRFKIFLSKCQIRATRVFSYKTIALWLLPHHPRPLELVVLIHQIGWLQPWLTSRPKIDFGVELKNMEPQGERFWAAQPDSGAAPTSRIRRCEVGLARSLLLQHKLLLEGFSLLHGCFDMLQTRVCSFVEARATFCEIYEWMRQRIVTRGHQI